MKLLLLFLILISSMVSAQVTGDLGIYSNYLWRGTTFSDNQPVVQLGLTTDDYNGLYAGTFISNATMTDGSRDRMNQEVDVLAGYFYQSDKWKLNAYFNRYLFPGAGVYDTQELTAVVEVDHTSLRVSQMDDFFGFGSIYRYVRLGHEWYYRPTLGGGLYLGYNLFSDQKKAGNSDYFDVNVVTSKKLLVGYASLTVNWTNRQIYNEEGHQSAKDFGLVIGYSLPFSL